MAPGGPPPFLVLPIATVPGLAHQVVDVGVVGDVVLAPVALGVLPDVLVGLDRLRDRGFVFFLDFIAGADVRHVRSVPASADSSELELYLHSLYSELRYLAYYLSLPQYGMFGMTPPGAANFNYLIIMVYGT